MEVRQADRQESARSGGRRIRGLDAEQRRAERREKLLTAAFELFARDGYADTAIEQICQTAYVGNKAFYELFASKEDCYLALLFQIAEQIEARVTEALQQSVADRADGQSDDEADEETVRRMLAAFVHTLVDDPRVAVVTFGMAAGVSPRIEAQRRENRRWAAQFVEAFWRRDQTAGAGTDHHAMAVATVGGLFDSVIDWLHQSDAPQPPTVDDLIRDMTTFVLVVEAGIHARRR